jgi:outer membrane protein OmpA-like peptidoglycan-associated protein
LLHRRGLIGRWQYWQWLEKGRSRLTSAAAILAALLLVFGIGSYSWSGPNRAWGLLKYEQTRFLKSNGSQRDYWRSRNYIASEMARVDLTETAEQTMARRAAIVGPLIDELTFKDITEQQAARTLRLIVDVHSQDVNQITVPRLIDSLRTENIDVRLRINGTLLDLQAADYPMASVDRDPFKPLKTWIPKADETPGETNHFVQLWKQWWSEAIQPPSSPAAPSTIEKTLETPGNVELKGVQFDFDRATLQPESGTVLAEVASILGRHPDWKVSIEGYTDSKGGARHNQDLSERRAGAVKSALIDMYHVDGSRLTSKGFGAASPIASNDTDDGRARNRRVELKRLP